MPCRFVKPLLLLSGFGSLLTLSAAAQTPVSPLPGLSPSSHPGSASLPNSPVAPAAAPTPSPFLAALHGHGRYVKTPDGRLYYESEGKGSPVVLVAGGPGGSHSAFHPWFSQLAAGHTVIYFDNIGRGRSDRLKNPQRYTVERDADDIEALRKALGYRTISVLGHSYGGMPALAYALKYPTHTARLVLSDTLDSAYAWQQNIDSANFNSATRFPEIWARLTALRAKGVKTGTARYEDVYGPTVDDLYWFDPRNAAKMMRFPGKVDALDDDVYHALLGDDPEWRVGGTMKGYDPRPRMRTLHVPTLICVGRYDRVALPKIAYEMKNRLPAATSTLAIFNESGHRPWVEETNRYFQVVGDFLSGRALAVGR